MAGGGLRRPETARARAAKWDDEIARVEAAVRTAEGRVEKVTEAFATIGYSEPLAAKLRAEEARLLEARAVLGLRGGPVSPAPLPRAYSARAVLAVVDSMAEAALNKPQKGREPLRAVVEEIRMEPKPDGYAVRITLRQKPRRLGGRRGCC